MVSNITQVGSCVWDEGQYRADLPGVTVYTLDRAGVTVYTLDTAGVPVDTLDRADLLVSGEVMNSKSFCDIQGWLVWVGGSELCCYPELIC